MSKFKEMKESVKEKGKQVGDWIENNFGKACFLSLAAFEVGLFTYLKVSTDKSNEKLVENNKENYDKCHEAYENFLEGVLEKTFEEKGVKNKMERLEENLKEVL